MLFVTLFAETKFCSIILILNLEHLAMLNDEQKWENMVSKTPKERRDCDSNRKFS